MYSNERMTFKVKNEQGKEIEYEVLFTFESEETNKKYIVYTDNSTDDEGNTRVYASIYEGEGENVSLKPIETEKEWKIIDKILEEIQNQVKEQANETSED